MGEAGVLAPGARVELIEGQVFDGAPLYARHGISELRVIDLENALVRFHRRPAGGAYADISATHRPGARPIAASAGISLDRSAVLR